MWVVRVVGVAGRAGRVKWRGHFVFMGRDLLFFYPNFSNTLLILIFASLRGSAEFWCTFWCCADSISWLPHQNVKDWCGQGNDNLIYFIAPSSCERNSLSCDFWWCWFEACGWERCIRCLCALPRNLRRARNTLYPNNLKGRRTALGCLYTFLISTTGKFPSQYFL